MFDSNNPHNDPKLAMKCYPSGNKRVATSKCICGSVEIRVETDDPVMTAFCHCWNCRIGHAAPMYQCFYVPTANIDCRTGEKKAGDHEIQVTRGFEHLVSFPGGMENAFFKNETDSDRVGGIGRMYCGKCGTRVLNAFYRKVEDQGERYGVFPATFTETMSNFIQAWQPRSHLNCESAIIPVAALCDGLPKYVEWDTGPKFID
tara:strand:+ start:381 stop:989 length:609 start_codon:yes stop_codon:yes gene_type:complete